MSRLERRFLILLTLSAAILAAANTAFAEYGGELRELYRGARMTGMGGAFVAIADDEQAVWVNPAGLAGIQNARFHYAAVDAEFSNDIASEVLTGMPTLTAFQSGDYNALVGKNVYGRVQITPTLVMPGLGISIISDHQVASIVKNQVFPDTTVGMQSTNGVQLAQGFSLLRKRRRGGGEDLRVGIAAKALWRRGGYQSVPLTDLFKLSMDYVYSLAGSYGFGYGVDLGVQYVRPLGRQFRLSAGAAYTDIGDISFTSGADSQKGNLSAGVGLAYRARAFDFTFAADYRHINKDTDWRKRTHAGFEFALPLVRLYGGLNQMLFTYGASVDIWLLRATAISYLEARGQSQGQDDERRWLARLDAKFSF